MERKAIAIELKKKPIPGGMSIILWWNKCFTNELNEIDLSKIKERKQYADSHGYNALHFAAEYNRKNTELIQLLLTHMTLNSINKKQSTGGTPLDYAYRKNHSPIRQEIIALLRLKGGKANKHDENGRWVGRGNGEI